MRFLKEFKEFITKGNIIDLAVAVVIGSAFGAIVSSLVNDVITPLLLTPALEAAHVQNLDKLTWGAVKYGNFIAAVIQFTIISLALFITVKAINALIKKKQAALPTPGPSTTDQLLMEIRDALKK
jgi:large conductance mechanosensitive channel